MEIYKCNVEQGRNWEMFHESVILCIGAEQFF